MKGELTWIELSQSRFRHNIRTIQKLIGNKVFLAPCVKANAYGHGLLECANIFTKAGADWLCIDCADEAIFLRENGIHCPMLIMGYVGPVDLWKVVKYNVRVFLYDFRDALELSHQAKKLQRKAFVHIKIDTGMNRQGVEVKRIGEFLHKVKKLKGLNIEGIATHFATADELSRDKRKMYEAQKKNFEWAIQQTRLVLGDHFIVHGANSGAVLTDPHSYRNLVRPGIAIYGYYPNENIKQYCVKKGIMLKPALTLNTTVAQIKSLAKGDSVSYGVTFTAQHKMNIAVLPIGYYDGIRRHLSNIGWVLLRGKRANIVGRVCMNIMMVDVTRIAGVQVGDIVTVIGKQGKEAIYADTIATMAGTISYEIMVQMRESIKKFIVA